MNKVILIPIAALVLGGCFPRAKITVPDILRNGMCERPVPAIKGTTGQDIYRFAHSALDKVEQCQIEKKALIELIDKTNKVSNTKPNTNNQRASKK